VFAGVGIVIPLFPIANKGYIVHVIGGTSTIGGVGYTTGSLVYRFYNGITWASVDMNAGGAGATNLGYTASPTNGIVTSDTGTDATLPLADVTNAGLLAPADFTQLSGLVSALALKAPLASPTLTGTPTAPTQSANDNSTKIATTAYADAKVADAITDGVTTIAPSQNAVFDALALKLDKSTPANTIKANNTGSTANVSDFTFKQVAQQAYGGTVTWTAGTAPSGSTNQTYTWSQIGNQVTVRVNLSYAVAGSTCTVVLIPLPTDCPAPLIPTGFTGSGATLYFGGGGMQTALNAGSTGASRSYLRRNVADTGFELVIFQTSISALIAGITVTYFTD